MADTVKKITKRERFAQLKELVKDNAELVSFIDHEVELLDKKNSADKKPTKTQVANEGIKDNILDVLAVDKAMSVTEIQKALDEELTNQKISALLRQLVAEGSVERIEEKNKAFFKKVA